MASKCLGLTYDEIQWNLYNIEEFKKLFKKIYDDEETVQEYLEKLRLFKGKSLNYE